MKTTINLFGIIALMAIIGFSMTACGEETKPNTNDPYKLNVQVLDNTFGNTDQLTGNVRVAFMNSDGISVDALSWLTKDSFTLTATSTSGGNRTISINSITKSQYNSGRVDVTLALTRSAVPNFNGGLMPTDSMTATVSVTGGGGYTIEMNSNAYFTF
jgi:hypothetical protein